MITSVRSVRWPSAAAPVIVAAFGNAARTRANALSLLDASQASCSGRTAVAPAVQCMRSQLSRDSLPSSLPTTAVAADLVWDDLIVLQSNIDDVSPQVLAYTMDKLLATGALDVWVVGCIMKKGRQGMQLNVLCRPEQRDELVAIVLQETTSLGVRVHTCERASLPRQFVQVSTPWGAVNVKLGLAAGAVVNAQPEYEDCAALAKQHGVPLKQVIDAAKAEYHCGRRLEQLQSAAPPAGRKQDKS